MNDIRVGDVIEMQEMLLHVLEVKILKHRIKLKVIPAILKAKWDNPQIIYLKKE